MSAKGVDDNHPASLGIDGDETCEDTEDVLASGPTGKWPVGWYVDLEEERTIASV